MRKIIKPRKRRRPVEDIFTEEPLTDAQVAELLHLNRRLTELERNTRARVLSHLERLNRDWADPNDWMQDWEFEASFDFVLREDDPLWDDDDDNILASWDLESFKTYSGGSVDSFIGDGENHSVTMPWGETRLDGERQCWLFHVLYDDLHVPLREMLRIGEIWVDLNIRLQRFEYVNPVKSKVMFENWRWKNFKERGRTPRICAHDDHSITLSFDNVTSRIRAYVNDDGGAGIYVTDKDGEIFDFFTEFDLQEISTPAGYRCSSCAELRYFETSTELWWDHIFKPMTEWIEQWNDDDKVSLFQTNEGDSTWAKIGAVDDGDGDGDAADLVESFPLWSKMEGEE